MLLRANSAGTPEAEMQEFLFTEKMLKQTKTDTKLENVYAKISVSSRKAEQLVSDCDLKHSCTVIGV